MIFLKENKLLETLNKAHSFKKYIFAGLSDEFGYGLNKTQRGVLMYISFAGSVSMKEVSERFALEKGSFTQVADSLEKLSLIERKRCESDRRIVYLTTTDKGKEVALNIHKSVEKRVESLLNRLPAIEKRNFLNCLDKIVEDIDIIQKGN